MANNLDRKVDEHQKFLGETQGVPTDEDIIVGGN